MAAVAEMDVRDLAAFLAPHQAAFAPTRTPNDSKNGAVSSRQSAERSNAPFDRIASAANHIERGRA